MLEYDILLITHPLRWNQRQRTFQFGTSNLENHEFGHNFFRKPPIKLEIAEMESPDLHEYSENIATSILGLIRIPRFAHV